MTQFGWDASDYDWSRGPMDLVAASNAGIVFFTHKATEGTSVKHVHCGEAVARARAAGIPFIGVYHVVHTANVPGQVDYLINYTDAQAPWWRSFPGWFWQADCENWGSDFPSPATCKAFCDLLAARTGWLVVCYASRGQYSDSLSGLGHPLWNAAYPSSAAGNFRSLYPGDNSPNWAPYSGQTPIFWQYTDNATIGRQPGCDANAYRGTLDQLRALLAPSSSAPTTENRMYQQQLPTGSGAEVILLFPYGDQDNPAFSIGCDTGSAGARRAAFRIAAHVAGQGWTILFDVNPQYVIDSQDGSRRDVVLPKHTDRVSVRRIPVDATDTCAVPAAVLAWW